MSSDGRRTELSFEVPIRLLVADRERIVGALDAGACGYLLKDAEPEELVRGIRAAARREAPFAPRAAAQFMGVTDGMTSGS